MTSHWQAVRGGLRPTHPTRLGLAINESVFHYEERCDHEQAIALAREAYDSAASELETLAPDQEEARRDAALVMQLIRDNLTLWQREAEEREPRGGR